MHQKIEVTEKTAAPKTEERDRQIFIAYQNKKEKKKKSRSRNCHWKQYWGRKTNYNL